MEGDENVTFDFQKEQAVRAEKSEAEHEKQVEALQGAKRVHMLIRDSKEGKDPKGPRAPLVPVHLPADLARAGH